MTAPSSIVAAVARMLTLIESDPGDRDQLKNAFRDLYGIVEPAGATLAVDMKGMLVDGMPLPHGLPGGDEVRARFHRHGVGTVRVPAAVKPADLLAVVRLLASEPIGVGTVESFVQRLPVEAALAIQVDGPRALPLAGDVRTLANLSAPVGGSAPSADRPAAPPVPSRPAPSSRPSPREDPGHDPLRDIEVQADQAYRREDWEELLSIATKILRAEADEQDENRRRRYSVTLRRVLPKSALQHIARAALPEGRRAEATAVLKRMDADAVEALLELLTAAPTLAERRGYFGILTKMESGTDRIVTRLNHPDWFVVRNVAELCGELRLTGAVRSLAGQVTHRDERVRRAVAGALGKIATPDVLAPLRQLVNDVEPVVRLQAVQGHQQPVGAWPRHVARRAAPGGVERRRAPRASPGAGAAGHAGGGAGAPCGGGARPGAAQPEAGGDAPCCDRGAGAGRRAGRGGRAPGTDGGRRRERCGTPRPRRLAAAERQTD